MKALTLFVVMAAGCGGLLSFDIQQSGTTTIPGGSILGNLPVSFGNFGNMSFSQDQTFKNQNTNKDHISECRLTKLTLKVTQPAGNDLSFLSGIEFYVSAPGLAQKRIAHKSPLPAGVSSVDLDLDDVDIAPYAKSDQFSITTQASGRSPAQDTTVEADLTLNVHASLL